MRPTNEDLARLIPDARTEAERGMVADDLRLLAADARDIINTAMRLMAADQIAWAAVRGWALRALYLCALIAWESGRRVGLPNEPPTSAETPAAKHDVEALLREVDRRNASGAYTNHPAHEDVREWTNGRIAIDLAAALRAERERANFHHRAGTEIAGHNHAARGHLRAVLDFMWPVGGRMTSPTVVQKARAFLAGEAQATVPTCNFCNGALENQSFQGLADRVDEVQRLRKDLAEAKERADQSRREVLTEDEAHAATRARLAEVERDLAATKERLADAQHSFKRRADELDYLRAENRKALAAQNLAESEAAGLRAQLVDLETAIRGLVDRVEKGRA
jgi:hypothetical protein